MTKIQGYVEEVLHEDTSTQLSWNGSNVDYSKIEIRIHDIDCGSPSIVEIIMKETWTTKSGKNMERAICKCLPRNKVIELRKKLCALQI